MSMVYCNVCDLMVDTDKNVEHFGSHYDEKSKHLSQAFFRQRWSGRLGEIGRLISRMDAGEKIDREYLWDRYENLKERGAAK